MGEPRKCNACECTLPNPEPHSRWHSGYFANGTLLHHRSGNHHSFVQGHCTAVEKGERGGCSSFSCAVEKEDQGGCSSFSCAFSSCYSTATMDNIQWTVSGGRAVHLENIDRTVFDI